MTQHVYKRYLIFKPDAAVEYLDFLLSLDLLEEAMVLLVTLDINKVELT